MYLYKTTFDRRVLKIHGSINNIGSIVATTKNMKNVIQD